MKPGLNRNVLAGGAALGVLLLVAGGWAVVHAVRVTPVVVPVVELPIATPEPTPAPPPPVAEPEADEPPAPTVKTATPPRNLGGKKVVLEYDTRPAPAPTPAPGGAHVDPPGDVDVAKARAIYQRGNAKLFAGDASAAEAAYLDALKTYPGYVASYRGLGFAYAEQGEKAKALAAFRLYVKTVPNARDTPLIKRRIEKLEKQ